MDNLIKIKGIIKKPLFAPRNAYERVAAAADHKNVKNGAGEMEVDMNTIILGLSNLNKNKNESTIHHSVSHHALFSSCDCM